MVCPFMEKMVYVVYVVYLWYMWSIYMTIFTRFYTPSVETIKWKMVKFKGIVQI